MRSTAAIDRQQVRKDYDLLQNQLEALSKEERQVKSRLVSFFFKSLKIIKLNISQFPATSTNISNRNSSKLREKGIKIKLGFRENPSQTSFNHMSSNQDHFFNFKPERKTIRS